MEVSSKKFWPFGALELVKSFLLKRHSIYSEAEAAGLTENWQYLLSILQQSSGAGAIDYDTMHRQARQGMMLKRDFGITASTIDLCL
ncbi:hypothetical protein MRX96_020979 [Rhipicephalus microplus]